MHCPASALVSEVALESCHELIRSIEAGQVVGSLPILHTMQPWYSTT